MSETPQEKCPICEGSGFVMDVKAELKCCGYVDEEGNCCNNPTQELEPIQLQCKNCEAGVTPQPSVNHITEDGITGEVNIPLQGKTTKAMWVPMGKWQELQTALASRDATIQEQAAKIAELEKRELYLRNRLVSILPTGEVSAFDLIKSIGEFIKEWDGLTNDAPDTERIK